MDLKRASLFWLWTFLSADMCLSQKDCTGVECPDLQNCIETVLESGACCPTCVQRGCTCKGYQYYDCIQAGFQKGKVPQGESYFVDYGSTECSCPQGGGKISCQFIHCPDLPPNCIDVLQLADGCPECGRVGCTHGSKKYEAGHSFQTERCQVCHCPNEGGRLTCSPIPGCELSSRSKLTRVTTTEKNKPMRASEAHTENRQTAPRESLSKLARGNTLPLYKQEPPSSGTGKYDHTPAWPTTSTLKDVAQPLESTTLPPAHPESTSISLGWSDEQRHELRRTQELPDPEGGRGEAEVTQNTSPAATDAPADAAAPLATTQSTTTENHRPREESSERAIRHNTDSERVSRGSSRASTESATHSKTSQGSRRRSPASSRSVSFYQQEKKSAEQSPHPKVQLGPTSTPPVRMREDEDQPMRQSQTLYNYQSQGAEGDAEVSATELVRSCCETGEKWATAYGHCTDMEPPTRDRHSLCWTAQRQCCLGSQAASRCLAGISAAKAGDVCQENASDKCGIDALKDCCDCCSLGLQLRREGHPCQAHHYLGFQCKQALMSCCVGEGDGDGSRERWSPPVREEPVRTSTPPPQRVSDSPYPKEAFSIGEERDAENTVEAPDKLEDMDECRMYEGKLCQHVCVNTQGSYRCECFPGYVLQGDDSTCAQEAAHEDNRLEENDGAAAEPTGPPPPPAPTEPAAPHNLCQGNHPCQQQCTPVGGRPQCSCFPGFSLSADGHSCEDLNECSSPRACQLSERCVNTVGSYACLRLISCPPGHRVNGDTCEDVNECVEQTHDCGPGLECVNTPGSFRCSPVKAQCTVGFEADAHGNCLDIDECGFQRPPCSAALNCVNTVGSYTCQRRVVCSRGYHVSPDGSRCVDVDECEGVLHGCGEGQLCHNLPGSYRCQCQTGYQHDSFRRMCVDVNECWRYPGRLCAQTCENTPGSYECSCTSGFRLSSDGKNCEDVNECLASPCSQECANIYGSYQCYCRPGYYLGQDGHTCHDIDECAQSIGHLCTYKCVNVPGSYQCACPEHGYTMSPNGRSCRDVDECTTGSHNCSLAETCYNIQGGHRCLSLHCPPNYRKVSDTRCERISCPNYLDCQNSPLRITYYYLSFQSNIVIPAQIFRIGPSPAYSGDNVIVSITQGNEENYFSTRKLNAYTGAVYLHRQVDGPRDFFITTEMKLWRQGTFTTFQARIYVFITGGSF